MLVSDLEGIKQIRIKKSGYKKLEDLLDYGIVIEFPVSQEIAVSKKGKDWEVKYKIEDEGGYRENVSNGWDDYHVICLINAKEPDYSKMTVSFKT